MNKINLTVVSFIVLCWFEASAQIDITHVGIEPSVTAGCSPLIVNFQDTSSSNGITYREYRFGNGNTATGNNTSVSASYSNSGLYTVEYIVSDGIDTFSVIYPDLIQVFEPPVLNYSFNPNGGCAPLNVTFSNNSQPGDAPITGYIWDFGDGSAPSTTPSPSHFYQFGNTYGVSLEAIDANGCTSSFTGPQVVVDNQPTALFTALPTNLACAPPLSVSFQNNSSGNGLSYQWNIGGSLLTTFSPSLSFNTPTVQDVTLIVTDQFGCSDTMSEPNYISVGTVEADFDFPPKVCVGEQVQFFNTSTGGANFSWTFSNGSNASIEDPIVTFGSTGTYQATLTITSSDGNCSDSKTKTVEVVGVDAQFTASPLEGCEVPHVVNFTNLATGTGTTVSNYFWELDSTWSSSSQANPTYTYMNEGTFDITFVAISPEGCADTVVAPAHVVIDVPELEIQATPEEGCIPLDVSFQDLTSSIWPIQSTVWDFDNGQTASGSTANTTYTQTGEYIVTMEVTTVNGCVDTAEFIVKAGTPQTPNFTISDSISCAFDTLYFDNLSFDTNLIDDYRWEFGDGIVSTEFEPAHVHVDTGHMSITLITDYNGCKDTLIVDSVYYSVGPVVSFGHQVVCDVDYQVNYFGNIIMADSFYWDFGDGSAFNVIDTNPTHVYQNWGNYYPFLHASNDSTGCYYEIENEIRIRDPIAELEIWDTASCLEDKITFVGTYSQHATQYDWDFGFPNAPVTTGIGDMAAQLPGIGWHNVELIVSDENNCKDTTDADYYVTKPLANYNASPTSGCEPLTVQFNNLSTSDTTISSYDWSYLTAPTSGQAAPSVTYDLFAQNISQYSSQLIVTDVLGCTDTVQIINHIKVYKPSVSLAYSKSNLCIGEPINFVVGSYNSNYTYTIDLDNGNTVSANSGTASYTYANEGIYYPSVTATDTVGCDSTFTLTTPIQVHQVDSLDFFTSITDTTCYPANIVFYQNSNVTGQPLSYWWDFGNGFDITSASDSVFYTFTSPGFYDISFAVTNAYGCSDTITRNSYIDIGGPLLDIVLPDDSVCQNQPFEITVSNTNAVEEYIWDFGDGTIDQYIQPSGTTYYHTYTQTGTSNIVLIYSGSNGTCTKQDSVSIAIGSVEASMILADSNGCEPFLLEFESNSTANNRVQWWLDNSVLSSFDDDSYLIQNRGNYSLSLVAFNDDYGCADTVENGIEVFQNPTVGITPEQTICIGDSAIIDALGGFSFEWSATTQFEEIDNNTIISYPDSLSEYAVTATDINGCQDSISTLVFVQDIPELTFFPRDTAIFEGQSLNTFFDSDDTLLFSWGPSGIVDCDNCPDPTISTFTSQWVTFSYQDVNGCFQSDTAFFLEVDASYNLNIPNAFTPNGDGINDFFTFEAYGVEKVEFFQIYNRWGQMVFDSQQQYPGWDGTVNGQEHTSNSIFYYKLRIKRFNGKTYDYEGKLILLNK